MSHSDEPGQKLERTFSIRHLAPTLDERIHALTGQTEQARQLRLVAILYEVGRDLSAQFVP
jgi:hypothetical protein